MFAQQKKKIHPAISGFMRHTYRTYQTPEQSQKYSLILFQYLDYGLYHRHQHQNAHQRK